ncbi:MAG: HD domain-containing protein [Ignavibacteriae bacterium]|nr:HD domain-containing protein [Ignavibacteriota bacterium]MCI0707902.1 HD domain-containing protein [Ignavibacteriota bacterium]
MTGAQAIHELERIVQEACAKESNIFGYGIWTHHITRVVENGKKLAPLFGANQEIVVIAALLHDYAGVKDKSLYDEHHIHGPKEAERILQQLGYAQDIIDAVKHCIESHRASVARERRSAEAECLANADALSHIENVPSLLHLAFVQHRMNIDDGALWVRKKLERSWNKLDLRLKEMIRVQYESSLTVLTTTKNPSKP